MRIDLYEKIHELAALRKRAGEVTTRIRREADLLADVYHELAELLSAIATLSVAQASIASASSRSSASTPTASSSPASIGTEARSSGMLRIDVVAARLGLSRSQVWRMVKEGRFPKPRRLSTRAVAWLEIEVTGWITARPVFDGPQQPPPRAWR
jgi:prophage regulatory protein